MLEHTDRELFEEDSLTETNNNNVNIKYTNKKKNKISDTKPRPISMRDHIRLLYGFETLRPSRSFLESGFFYPPIIQ